MSRLVTSSGSPSTAASQAKYESLTTMAVQLRVRVDELKAFSNGTFNTLLTIHGCNLRYYRDADGVADSQIYWSGPGTTGSAGFDTANLPANGTDVIIYAEYVSGGSCKFRVYNVAGASDLVNSTNGTGIASITTGGGTGDMSLQRGVMDSFAVYSAVRTGADQIAKPESTDGDMLGLYYFAEGTGTTTADSTGGTAITLNGGSWTTGGTWDADSGGGTAIAAISSGPNFLVNPRINGGLIR